MYPLPDFSNPLHYVFVHMQFYLHLCYSAWSSTFVATGYTAFGIILSLGYVLVEIVVAWKKRGWPGVIGHWQDKLKRIFILTGIIWTAAFCYHLFYNVPHQITVEAYSRLPRAY